MSYPLVLEAEEDIRAYLKDKDVLLVPRHFEKYFGAEATEIVKGFKGELIDCYYEMDEGSHIYLENKIKRILNEKTI